MSWTLSAASLAALAGLTRWKAQRRRVRAEEAHPPSGEFVSVEGRRVHFRQEGEGPDLVLIHGANGNLREWTFDLTGRLTNRYRVTVFDRPGLGWSDRTHPRYEAAFAAEAESPSEQAAMLSAAAGTLGIRTPIVLGHSYGGAVALAWALDHPARALVLLAGVANPWPGGLGWIYRVNGTSLGGGLVTPLISAWAPPSRIDAALEGIFAPQPVPDGYAEHIGLTMVTRPHVFRANARQVNTLYPHIVEMTARYDDLDLPIELLHGAEDTSVPLSIHSGPLAARLDNAHLTVLQGVGHMPHHAEPDAVVAAIDRAASRSDRM